MGAILRVKVHYTALEPYLAQARERNIPVYGTFLEGENIYSTPLTPGGIVLMGNEGQGIAPAAARHVSHKLFIPPYPADRNGSESLNVAIAGRRLRRIPPAGERKEIRQVRKTRENRTGESAFSRQIPVRCIF